jgi:DNA-binding HxlR family transcriptional regulator
VARIRPHLDGCGIAHATELLGRRWALLVVRELLLGPKRFTDLRSGIPDISPNVLGERLRELEESGLVRRRKLPPPAAAQVYELTDWGAELEPAILALGRWATASPAFPRDAEMGADSLLLALKSTFQPDAAEGVDATYALILDGLPFRIRIAEDRFEARRGEADRADATIRTDPDTMAALVFRARPLAAALRTGEIEVEGSKDAARRLIRLLATGRGGGRRYARRAPA